MFLVELDLKYIVPFMKAGKEASLFLVFKVILKILKVLHTMDGWIGDVTSAVLSF